MRSILSRKALTKRKLPDVTHTAVLNGSRYGRILERIGRDLTPIGSSKAVRILEWIACSFRLMKVHEIQDGIVLHTIDAELNEETKLCNTAFLDLCRPLIEEGPNNTVDFVHYSAKEQVGIFTWLASANFKPQVHPQ
jgi:hypothetical protein